MRDRVEEERALSSCCDPATGAGTGAGFVALFTTGLLMSAGHCAGMCGPIVTAYHAALARNRDPRGQCPGARARSSSLLLYNAGRITSYAAIGIAIGALGAIAGELATERIALQSTLSILTGIAVIVAGLGLLGVLPAGARLERASWSRAVTSRILAFASSAGRGRSFTVGIANGLLPCGPVIAAALSASSLGSPLRSGLAMLAYGLGTVPLLVTLAFGARALSGRAARIRMVRAGASLVLLIGLQLAARGLAALGWAPHLHVGEFVLW